MIKIEVTEKKIITDSKSALEADLVHVTYKNRSASLLNKCMVLCLWKFTLDC